MIWEKLFLAYIAFLPFVVWNGNSEGSKVFYLFIGAISLCVFYLITLGNDLVKSLNKYDLYYGIFLLVLIVSSVFGVHPLESIIGGSYRHQGVIFFFAIWLIGKKISTLSNTSKKNLKKIILAWVVIESLLVIFQTVFSVNTIYGRAMGSLREPNAVAGMIAMTLWISPQLYTFILGLVAIVLLNSRSGFLAFLPSILQKFTRNKKRFLIVLLLLVPVGLFVFITAYRSLSKSEYEDRGVITHIAVVSIAKRPLVGYGAESGEVVYDRYFKSISQPIAGVIIDRSHNIILDILLWSGIAGLIPFCIWFCMRVRQLVLEKRWDRLSGVFSFTIYSFLQPLSIVHWFLLVIIFDL